MIPARVLELWDGRVVRRLGLVPLGCVVGVVLLLAAGSLTWRLSPTLGHSSTAQRPSIGVVPAAAVDYRQVDHSLAPTRVDIPALQVSAPITTVYTGADNELEVPQDPKTVGWWAPGARPGAAKGTAVLAGHINYAGVQGAFSRLGDLRTGDKVVVHGTSLNAKAAESLTFTVVAVRHYPKTDFPSAQIFDQAVAGRLALITCGGIFDNSTGNYLDNIVVYAVPTG